MLIRFNKKKPVKRLQKYHGTMTNIAFTDFSLALYCPFFFNSIQIKKRISVYI